MQAPISTRKGIPFFHEKTELEYQQDNYERYDEMVVRHSALHLADELWGAYPYQNILDFAQKHYPTGAQNNILEIGCGVGRWISSLAKYYPTSTCWGIDYSYQMLKRANEFWVEGKEISINWSDKGLKQITVKGKLSNNLNFGLAKAESLPFENNSQDMVVSSFLLDRVDNPSKALMEIHRVLKPKGKLVMLSPLNFQSEEHWKLYYPSNKISTILKDLDFTILEWNEGLTVNEPLDRHGNLIRWKCLGFVAEK